MSHSSQTAYKYYQFPETATKAADMHSHIVQVTKKQHFTKEEDELLLKEWPLIMANTPSFAVCRDIVFKCNIGKSDKQLQDRWRNLKKHCADASMEL